MAKKRDIHVVPHKEGGWATRREGAGRAGSRQPTQRDAIERAGERAKRERVEVVIHRSDGTIRDSDSYHPFESESAGGQRNEPIHITASTNGLNLDR